jgi:hypothetical protein
MGSLEVSKGKKNKIDPTSMREQTSESKSVTGKS